MRLVFLGSGDFSVPALRTVHGAGHETACVVTMPDRPAGRGRKLCPTPAKEAALELGLPIWQPARMRGPEAEFALREMKPELGIVVDFGQIIPGRILEIPPLGFINLHASLLPRHRGASPIQRAILDGDPVTGVTTMFMDEGLDTGAMILQRETPIRADDTAGSLGARLAELGAGLLVETLDQLSGGRAPRRIQDDSLATYAPRLRKEDGLVRWTGAGKQVYNQVRGLDPWPGAYTFWRGSRLKILKVSLERSPETRASDPVETDSKKGKFATGTETGMEPGAGTLPETGTAPDGIPGTILKVIRGVGFLVSTGDRPILIERVQPENGKPMGAWDFANGYGVAPGERFEPYPAEQ